MRYLNKLIYCFIAALLTFNVNANAESKIKRDSVNALSEVAVVAKAKQRNNLREEPLSATILKLEGIERKKVNSLTDLANQTPNLYIPNYGSKMTSSIYVRGLGSRIDNPAVGMYIDNIPFLNKNGFDLDMWDIMRMEVLRGPQSTLYGRNTIGGIINIYTLSPMVYQGVRLSAGYSSGNTFNAKGSVYAKLGEKVALGVGGNYYTSDGFFNNEYNNSNCDWIDSESGRIRFIYAPNSKLTFDNSFLITHVKQGGYAYRLYDTEKEILLPINYNDKCGYERITVSDGLTINYKGESVNFSSVTSWQFLDDDMVLDQDFTPKSMFNLRQAQKEHSVAQDFVLKNYEGKKYNWLVGATLFYKDMEMDAPVKFKEDGVNILILDNINRVFQNLPASMNTANLAFKEPEFDLLSYFELPVFGAALYHQSQLNLGKFTLTAGLRFDYEKAKIDYNSNTAVDYIYSMKIQMHPAMPPREIKVENLVESTLEGNLESEYFEVLPKFALQYSLEDKGNLYASVTKGFKAGGYNTQMFSDILQNQFKADLMADVMGQSPMGGGAMGGGASSPSYSVDEIITYKPEYSWNYELGGHLNLLQNGLAADFSLFYIDCTDQQLTVFPDGTTTGRMMTNAGETRSIGGEIALNANILSGLNLGVSYGYTNARFVNYNDGITDYKDKYVPYVPKNTLAANLTYTLHKVGFMDNLSFRIGYNGIGEIYWNEENSVKEDFYSLLNASICAEVGDFTFELWSKNLTDTNYNAFYFVSVGNTFFSQGRPAEFGATLSISF